MFLSITIYFLYFPNQRATVGQELLPQRPLSLLDKHHLITINNNWVASCSRSSYMFQLYSIIRTSVYWDSLIKKYDSKRSPRSILALLAGHWSMNTADCVDYMHIIEVDRVIIVWNEHQVSGEPLSYWRNTTLNISEGSADNQLWSDMLTLYSMRVSDPTVRGRSEVRL